MAITIEEFLVSFGYDYDSQGGEEMAEGLNTSTASAVEFGAVAGATAAVATKLLDVVIDFARALPLIAEGLDAIDDLSLRTRSAAEDLARLEFQASQLDSTAGAVRSSVVAMTDAIDDASRGIGTGTQVFNFLGINVRDANGQIRETTDVLQDVRNRISEFDEATQRAVLNQLGIDQTLFRLMTEDLEELDARFNQVFDAIGLDLGEAADRASAFRDRMGQIQFVMTTLSQFVASEFLGAIEGTLDDLIEQIIIILPKLAAAVVPVIEFLLQSFTLMVQVTAPIIDILTAIFNWIVEINESTDGWLLTLAGIKLAFAALSANPIIGILTAIGLLIDDFQVWKAGGESLIDWEKWEPGINLAIEGITLLAEVVGGAIGFIIDMIASLVQLLTGDFEGAGESFSNAAGRIGDALNFVKFLIIGVIDELLSFFGINRSVVDLINQAWGFVVSIMEGVAAYFELFWDLTFGMLIDGIKILIQLLTGDFTGAWDTVAGAIDRVLGLMGTSIEDINKLIDGIGKFGEKASSFLGFDSVASIAGNVLGASVGGGAATIYNITNQDNRQITANGVENPDRAARLIDRNSREQSLIARQTQGAIE